MSECENCEQLDYAAIVGDAKRFERERIIKLLEEAVEDDEDQYRLGWAIDLIKGENK